MAQRILPGAYVTLKDESYVPEGQTALTVGYVLQANRGPVNQLQLVTSPSDFLTKYTFSGKPGIEDDKTFWSILKVLPYTNTMYISRAANYPLYGGVVLRSYAGSFTKAVKSSRTFTMLIDVEGFINPGDKVSVRDTRKIDGIYTVQSVSEHNVVVVEDLAADYSGWVPSTPMPSMSVIASPIDSIQIGEVEAFGVDGNNHKLQFNGDIQDKFSLGCKFIVKGAESEDYNRTYTVETNEASDPISYDSGKTFVIVKETIPTGDSLSSEGAVAYYSGLTNPNTFKFGDASKGEVMLITGIDPGYYNNDIALEIKNSVEFPEEFVYTQGNIVGGKECTFNTIQLTVYNSNTGDELESFLFSRDPEAKTIDGISLYVDNVVAGSAYIKVRNNTEANKEYLPKSTLGERVYLRGGSNGDPINAETLQAALEPFKDQTVTLSILGNGCSSLAETTIFQQALMEVANQRNDVFVFLNDRASDENKTLNSQKAQAIVDYKKKDLANTSFYGCMYAPHVNTSDIYNQRQVSIGAEAVAIAGWLNVITNLNYPYAYAGPRNGLVQGVTCDWKIGDMSGEAQILNDASVNYVAYDGKVGRYYMQCQNTLQVANSAMRNIGTVLNVLDIKEHFVTLLKEYLQLPITNDLRREIVDVSNDYLSPMLGVRFSNYSFQDVTRDIDLADNTLRYLLVVAPTPYSQKIYLVMNIVNATFDFSVLQSL